MPIFDLECGGLAPAPASCSCSCLLLLLSKPLPVFDGGDKCLDHLRLDEVPVELIQLVQPEFPTAKIGIRRIIWISSQVSVVLHEYERPSGFLLSQVGIFRYFAQHTRTPHGHVSSRIQFGNQLIPLG